MDKCYQIILDRVKLQMQIGVYPEEQIARQEVIVKLVLDVVRDAVGIAADDYDAVLCYDKLVQRIVALQDLHHIKLLERLGAMILDLALDDPLVMAAHVELAKPAALGTTADVRIKMSKRKG
ncbi:MAG: dihydroneopterin aldolase [Pseudomonadota bacterium]